MLRAAELASYFACCPKTYGLQKSGKTSRRRIGLSVSSLPKVLIVAGSDSGGGAGIQADLKTCLATGSFGMTAITAITCQNTFGVQAVYELSPSQIEGQITSILSDMGADVVKIGMIPSIAAAESIAKSIKGQTVVLDPVMVSTSGHELSSTSVASKMISDIFPMSTVVTPNLQEAEIISQCDLSNSEGIEKAARTIHSMGPQVVVIKGGHGQNENTIEDVVYDGDQITVLPHKRVKTNRLHGTGCTLASAIASYMAQGLQPVDAIRYAVQYLTDALENSFDLNIGQGVQLPFNHGYRWHTSSSRRFLRNAFNVGVYAITDSGLNAKHNRSMNDAIRDAVEGGATMIQIREKDGDARKFLDDVSTAISVAENVPVLVNDRIDVALAAGADGVHIGQEDMPLESVRRLVGPTKIVGVSAKTVEQAIKAEAAGADYIGVGAIYSSPSKDSTVIGLNALTVIREAVDLPIVAIGGISAENAPQVVARGANGVASIAAIFDVPNVKLATSQLKNAITKYQ